ncbi:MAG: aminoacetone oxidase family FAD-binding enzyme [Lentisphaerae bacterium]|nr:aminoacetone oxidase family FAD-binding enzyme [Lentisphaerota bacterium]
MTMDLYDTIIIGSGPAGLAAACAAGMQGKKVLILEKQPFPAMKLLASGGGRCNVSNTLPLEDFAGKFGRQWRFLLPALSRFHGETLLDFFQKRHVPLILPDGFHYFPASGKATDVRDALLNEIRQHGGQLLCNEKVINITPGRLWAVQTQNHLRHCRQLVCACGGRGYPALGGSMAGFDLVSELGHKVTGLFPAMTGVIAADPRVGECAGIALEKCAVTIDLKGRERLGAEGELLFTHRGFSAFAILDLAGAVAKLLTKYERVPLKIDFLPQYTAEDIDRLFASWRKSGGTRHISTLLAALLPKRVAGLLLDGDDPEISNWRAGSSARLAARLKGAKFDLCGVENWDKAMVTDGGIPLKEVDPQTLQSKLFPGLFFAGEMLDVTGPCGGFNISWALASGMLAGSFPLPELDF